MDKNQLTKILRRKIYWERERDKYLSNIFLFHAYWMGLTIKINNYSGIKKITEIGWSQAKSWDKFNCIFDWFLLVILVIYIFLAIYSMLRIQMISQKLVDINQRLLKELDNSHF